MTANQFCHYLNHPSHQHINMLRLNQLGANSKLDMVTGMVTLFACCCNKHQSQGVTNTAPCSAHTYIHSLSTLLSSFNWRKKTHLFLHLKILRMRSELYTQPITQQHHSCSGSGVASPQLLLHWKPLHASAHLHPWNNAQQNPSQEAVVGCLMHHA